MKQFFLLIFFIAACSCHIDFTSRPRNFSIELVHFTQLQKDGHVVISPFGIWTLMTGVALGASGRSYSQLSRTFLLPRKTNTLISEYKILNNAVLDSTTKGVSISSTNFMFVADNFKVKSDFERTVTNDFGAVVKKLNFNDPDSAANIANSYIENTGGKVSNVLTSEDFAESRMLLSNVISFEGLWSSPFNKSETKREPFYNEQKEIAGEVNMMSQRAEVPFSNVREMSAFVVEMPYGNDGKYSMLFFLPHPKAKVADVYNSFARVNLKDVFKKLDDDIEEYGLEQIDVKIPRFKISTNVVLNKPLNDMGVYDIFEPDIADFSRMTNEKIFVSAIVHKADIEVTESGTVASASSTATFADRKTTTVFKANKPFIYFLIEKSTTTILFGGIYSKPTVF